MRLFSQINMFAAKVLFSALLFLFLAMFFGVMLLPWLYLPLVAFLFFRRLFKAAVWVYAGIISVTILQMLVLSAIYPKHYPPDTDVYFFGGLPVAPSFLYKLQLNPEPACHSTAGNSEPQFCGFQLSQSIPLSPAATCTLRSEPALSQPLSVYAKAGLCRLTRTPPPLKPTPKTVSPAITVNANSEMFTLHAAFICSAVLLLLCLLLLHDIRKSYRQPSAKK